MSRPSAKKLAEWQKRAAAKDAIVPHYFEVFVDRVVIQCGSCKREYRRNLVPNVQEPTFVCPNENCRARNWIPVRYKLSF